jgi:hypothetical protein
MHRSGTSLTARVLDLLGIALGPRDTMLAADPDDNARGYWEQSAVMALNDDVLAQVGGSAPETLWLRYNQDALVNTAGCGRLLVLHDRWFSETERQLERLAELAGVADNLSEGVRREVTVWARFCAPVSW